MAKIADILKKHDFKRAVQKSCHQNEFRGGREVADQYYYIAGWSSPVAREAHNLEVVSSNLAPATLTSGSEQNPTHK